MIRLGGALFAGMFVITVAAGARAQKPAAPHPGERDPNCHALGDPTESAPPANTPEAPLASIAIEGRVLDRLAALEALVKSHIPERCVAGADGKTRCTRRWSASIEDAVRTVVQGELGYRMAVASRRLADGYHVRLSVAPVAVVRHVKIGSSWPIFSDEITRRVHLRPGTPLPEARCVKAELIQEEQATLRDYLEGRGYFDARVKVSLDEITAHEVTVNVDLRLGERYTVGSVQVAGATAIAPEEIAAMFRQKTWYSAIYQAPFSRDRMKRDARAAEEKYRNAGFPGARVRASFDPKFDVDHKRHRVTLHVDVRERRRLAVAFFGNNALSDEQLESTVTFQKEGAFDDLEAERSADAIFHAYQLQGYFEAEVKARRERFTEDAYDTVIFDIREGPQRPLRSVQFEGNRTFKASKLMGVIGTRARERGFVVRAEGLLTSTQLRLDLEHLVDFYRAEGFPEVKVRYDIAPSLVLLNRPGATAAVIGGGPGEGSAAGLVLRFTIDEGRRDLVGQITFTGVEPADRPGLLKVMAVKPHRPGIQPTPYHVDIKRQVEARLRRHYASVGLPYARIAVAPAKSTRTGDVDLHVTVTPGRPVRWGEVLVRGNFKTRTDVILRELPIHPGGRFDPAAADRGEQRLRALGLFNSVKLTLIGDERELDPIHVLVEVEERYDYRADFELAFGSSSDNIFFTSAAIIARNVGGFGHDARIGGELGFEVQAADAAYTIPRLYLADTPIAVRAAPFIRQEETKRLGTLLSFGGSLTLSREIARGLVAGLRYDIRQVNRSVPLVRGAGHDEDLGAVRLASRTGSLSAQMTFDRRNDPLLPTRGYRLTASALLAANKLGGTDDFVKLGGTAVHFWSISDRLMLSQGVRWDHGIPLSGVLLPAVERFFAGGDTTVRGYKEDHLFTEVIENGLPPFESFTQFRTIPQGGNIRGLYNIDLQVNVWKMVFPVAVAVFVDTGVVTNSLETFSIGDLRHSLGVSPFRWQSPFGFVSFEYAIPLDPKLGDDPTGRFHFNFGFVF